MVKIKICEYDVKDIEKKYKVPEGTFQNDFVIIDNETQNNIAPDWDYTKAKISIVGLLYKNKVKIFIAEKENDKEFKTSIKKELNKLKKQSNIYAFNNNMELGNFKGDFEDYEIIIHEIKPFNGRGWNKDKFYYTLRLAQEIPDVIINDPFKGDGGKCIDSWVKFQETKDIKYMKEAIIHNLNCLLKESIILKHNLFFKKNWLIDEKNFFIKQIK